MPTYDISTFDEARRIEAIRQAGFAAEERAKLRDQFAAAALAGLMQYRQDTRVPDTAWKSTAAVAAEAYEIADAMLAARDGT